MIHLKDCETHSESLQWDCPHPLSLGPREVSHPLSHRKPNQVKLYKINSRFLLHIPNHQATPVEKISQVTCRDHQQNASPKTTSCRTPVGSADSPYQVPLLHRQQSCPEARRLPHSLQAPVQAQQPVGLSRMWPVRTSDARIPRGKLHQREHRC